MTNLNFWFGKETADLAKRFDARNGNDSFLQNLKELETLHVLAAPYLITYQKNN
ncbi:hypothetical protein LEP1GSC036_1294 [Leptospira weilii str. 2006001853]|uniref:Uncharacterized protein n=1 Tax=Leptospira weilii str. 2006001853 TaxID=1001589 RepID=A0A828Z2G5_9LEPT|nr:hypothetical protein [Leptospira weilii]EKR63928.1 hypothetical protein LEP1GSC036_1294 [Leptospira weilii str. 2006001853]EMN43133.1 hypothetical protein LEP1GSC086_0382 [Leptospira weilii str. LNT 1234]MCL8265483.1 hypothetical protein [Leptospira weilii]UPY78206.1 hypothetical protein FH581_004865 [Leptospira weilii]